MLRPIYFVLQVPIATGATADDIKETARDVEVALDAFGFKGAKVLGEAAVHQDESGDGSLADKAAVA